MPSQPMDSGAQRLRHPGGSPHLLHYDVPARYEFVIAEFISYSSTWNDDRTHARCEQ